MLQNTNYKLVHNHLSTIHNNTPDIIILDKTTKWAYTVDIPIPNRHNLSQLHHREATEVYVQT